MITLENVTKIYKGDLFETVALQNVSLKIDQGEMIAIMGESGSGKTTLLNILGGMDALTSGEYYLHDFAVHNCKPSDLDVVRKKYISFIFQHFALMEEYDVYENIEAPLIARNIKKSERKKRIKEVVVKLGIEDLIDKFPCQISGGQKQRVAFARAIVTDCPIILADEPTGALDEENTENIIKLFENLHREGKTIILITHDSRVASHAQKIIEIKDGRVGEL